MSARTTLMLGLLAWTLLTAQAIAQPPADGRLSGRIVSMSGSIADATVTLTRLDSSSATPVTVISDRQGRFEFERLNSGRYRVSASKSGYTNRRRASSAERFDTDLELTLRAGEPLPPIELRLHRESSIAGRVAEPDGIPAPDVHVFAAVRRSGGHVVLQETRTVAEWDGRYRIAGLPPGEYLVLVLPGASAEPNRMRTNAERRAPESSSAARPFFQPTLYPGVTSSASAESVTLFEGIPVGGIDIWLTPGERHSISGRVIWPDATIVEHVVIEYANVTAQRSGLWTVPEPGDVFSITGAPPGTVVLLARADSNRGPLAGAVTTHVSVDDVEDVELTLGPTGIVEGRIVYETDLPASARATQIRLKQRLLPVSALYPTPESVVTADGVFRIEHAFGEYDFELVGADGLRIGRVTQHGRALANGRIHVASGETIAGLEIVATK